jgi:Methyltransferase domain
VGLKTLRIKLFYSLLEPFSAAARRRRMRRFVECMSLRDGLRVLDLGGQPEIWAHVPHSLHVTLLNLPGAHQSMVASSHTFDRLDGDACDARQFADSSFDIVFSNSVIEHVGPHDKRAAFAAEARRLGKAFWVQTPAIWFPIEAHSGMPFWWFYPTRLRDRLLRRWDRTLPEWAQYIRETRIVARRELSQLFPGAQIYVERVLGIPKSYVAWSRGPEQAEP